METIADDVAIAQSSSAFFNSSLVISELSLNPFNRLTEEFPIRRPVPDDRISATVGPDAVSILTAGAIPMIITLSTVIIIL